MQLEKKTLYSFLILLIGMLIAVSVFSSFVVLSSYSSLEKQYVFKDLDQTIQMINDDENTLSVIVSDWGSRDDTYNFVKDDNSDYLTDNLIPGTFEKLRLNLIIIVNNQGGIIYQGAYDLKNNTMFPVPDSILNQITPGSPLLNMSDPQKATTGIILARPYPLIVASRPIVYSNFSGTPAGVVIMGRYLDANEVRYLAGLTRPTLALTPVTDPAFSEDLRMSLDAQPGENHFLVLPDSISQVEGYALIKDIYGNDALVVSFSEPRNIYQTGLITTRNFIYIILATGLVFGLVFVVIFNRILISRLGALNQQVQSIGHNHAIKKRINIGGDDEFSGLAGEINRMLDTIEKTQQGLQASETRFRELAELMPQTIFEIDLEGKILYINTAGADVFGVTKQKIADGTNIRDYVLPEYIGQMTQGLANVMAGGKSPGETYGLKKGDGSIMKALVSTSPIKRQGTIAGFRGVVVDITDRTLLKEQLEENTKLLSGILQASPVGVFRLDRQGHVIFVNETFSKITGIASSVILGKYWADILEPTDKQRLLGDISAAIKERKIVGSETRFISPDRSIYWLYGQGAPLFDSAGNLSGWAGTITDITERKKIEDAIALANKKLNLMNNITRHDILNTITGVYGLIDMAKVTTSTEERTHLLNDVKDLVRLIQRQIDFTKQYQEVGIHIPQWQNVLDVINRVLPNFNKSGINFVIDLKNVEIYADPLLEKVFYNLIDNSIRYGLTLTTISIYFKQSADGITLVFEDDGVGIPASEKEHIFERGVGKNTGLGLFMTREILLITQIDIRENSIPGKGARFEILVPKGTFRFPLI